MSFNEKNLFYRVGTSIQAYSISPAYTSTANTTISHVLILPHMQAKAVSFKLVVAFIWSSNLT